VGAVARSAATDNGSDKNLSEKEKDQRGGKGGELVKKGVGRKGKK